jgi:ParB-like chromosome segregation protein Spo0J
MKQIEYIEIKKLKLDPTNPRKISKNAFRDLCASIESDPTFLQCRPVLAYREDDELVVYAGNQRVRAAKHLNMYNIPCIVHDKSELTDEIIRHRVIRDNRHAGEFDYDELANAWDLNELLYLGFEPKDFDISLEDDKPKKEKKIEVCPNCGKEI